MDESTIADRFGLYISESNFDGRTKVAKYTQNFSWKEILAESQEQKRQIL